MTTGVSSDLNPTIRLAQFAPRVALTMPLGAISRIQHFGLAIRWDDRYGTDQFEKLRIKDGWLVYSCAGASGVWRI